MFSEPFYCDPMIFFLAFHIEFLFLFPLSLCSSLSWSDLLIPLRMKEFCVPIRRINEIILWVSITSGLDFFCSLSIVFLVCISALWLQTCVACQGCFASVLYWSWCVMIKRCSVLVGRKPAPNVCHWTWQWHGKFWGSNSRKLISDIELCQEMVASGCIILFLCSLENSERFQSKCYLSHWIEQPVKSFRKLRIFYLNQNHCFLYLLWYIIILLFME